MESEKPSEGKSAASNSCFPSGRFLILPEKIISIKIIPTKENIYTCKAEILRLYFILKYVKTVQSYVGDLIWTRNNGNKTKEYRIEIYIIKESKGYFCL